MLSAIDDPDVGVVMVPAVYPRLSKTPGRIDHLGPRHGQHTDEVLMELLGVSKADLTRLHKHKVI